MAGHVEAAVILGDLLVECLRERVAVTFHSVDGTKKVAVRLVHDGIVAYSELGAALDSFREARDQLEAMREDRVRR